MNAFSDDQREVPLCKMEVLQRLEKLNGFNITPPPWVKIDAVIKKACYKSAISPKCVPYTNVPNRTYIPQTHSILLMFFLSSSLSHNLCLFICMFVPALSAMVSVLLTNNSIDIKWKDWPDKGQHRHGGTVTMHGIVVRLQVFWWC